MKKDHSHNKIFHIMEFAFKFFVNQTPVNLEHTNDIFGDCTSTAQFFVEILFL